MRQAPLPRGCWLDYAVVLILACAGAVAVPIVTNQNQYLAHALAGHGKAIDADWFAGTVDPYPAFTALARAIFDISGMGGIRCAAFLGTTVALLGVYRLALELAPSARQRSIALAATVFVGATLVPVPFSLLPFPGILVQSAFMGLGGQYIISKPAYLQPSMFGCLLLLAFPFWLAAMRSPQAANRHNFAIALVLTLCGCMLHPTYMVAVGVALFAAFLSDAWQRTWRRVGWYTLIGLATVTSTIAANPALLAMSSSSPEFSSALERFAFERIPHHTLWTRWETTDLLSFMLIACAVLVIGFRRKEAWLALWLSLALGMGLFCAALLPELRSVKLALLFPWRVSVFLVPVSATVLAVEVASAIDRWIGYRLRWAAVILAFALGGVGIVTSLQSVSPATSDTVVALVRASQVKGVGLIPLELENMRLNAGVRIYVDWKSPPYASADLVEWWKRVDHVRTFAVDTETFCVGDWGKGIDWMISSSKQHLPACVANWLPAGESGEWRILARPPA
jgi:hypothetical protein